MAQIRTASNAFCLLLFLLTIIPTKSIDATQRYKPESINIDDPETPLISKNGRYLAQIGVGRPAKVFYFTIDTLSDLTWLQCLPCTKCYNQTDPIFDPVKSATYHKLPCSSCNAIRGYYNLSAAACGAVADDACEYGVMYDGQSFSNGELARETLTFGDSHSFENVVFGCGINNGENALDGLNTAAGVLGLSPGFLSLPSQTRSQSFSYCLVDMSCSNSSSTLNFNSVPPKGSIFVPMFRNPNIGNFFYVQVTGISVGGARLNIPASIFYVDDAGRGGFLIDSGSVETLLPAQAYNLFRDAFVNHTKDFQPLISGKGFDIFDTCYNLPSSTILNDTFPAVQFHFAGGKTLPLEPRNCLIPVDSQGLFCFGFAPTRLSVSVIGNRLQQGSRISFDIANRRVGFSPNRC